ncbi:ankyrin repeat-containing domain protein [Xylaria curta]|nr:ankyrin repeat-containing domain protein [Xylaria curta]
MSDEKVIADGKIAKSAAAKRDEERSNDGDGTADTYDLPRYSENEIDTHQKDDNAQQLSTRTNDESSQLLNSDYPDYDAITHTWARNDTRANPRHQDVIEGYFSAIKEGYHQIITDLLETNAVTTETVNGAGLTPLLAAVDAGHIETVRFLLEAGADPNAFGVVGAKVEKRPLTYGKSSKKHWTPPKIYRTPLQLAAAKGNLPVVKLLIETYHADDSLIAPDGELALRLASANGHREIVAYLPARRGGGFRRWKTRHNVAMQRAKRAAEGIYEFVKIFVYRVPRFFVWSIPKHVVVLPVVRRIKWLHAHRAELPRILMDGLKRFWEGVKAFPMKAWDFLKRIPPILKEVAELIRDGIVATIKGIPKAARIAALWAWNGIKTLMGVVGNAFDRLFSFLHTVLAAVGTFFRNITLKNVRDGFVAFVHVVFVEGPRKLWQWMLKFEDVSIKILKAMWGCFGEILGFMFWGLAATLIYVPKKLWEILVSMLGSIGYGGKEVMIWINPKR